MKRRTLLGASLALPTLLHARTRVPARTMNSPTMNFDRLGTASTTPSGSAQLRTYATAATGKMPIAFLHAGVCDSRMWHHEFATFGPARRVVAFDRRGFGQTQAVRETYANVDDTVAVMDASKVERAVLVGCSNGGRIALDTYFAHPDRVAGLVLVCGAIGGAPEGDSWNTDARLKAIYTRWIEAEKAHDRATLAKITTHVWLDGPLEREGRVGGSVRTLFVDMLIKSLAAPEDEDKSVFSDTAYVNLANVKVPTLVVWGTLDVPDVTATMKHAAATIPNAQSLEVPGTAHLPNLERPDLFTPRVARFVASLD